MMRGLIAALVLLASALPSLAAPSRTELLNKAAEGAAVCAQSMPDTQRTGDALRASGYNLDEGTGDLRAYTALGKRVVVLITGKRSSNQACVVLVSGMTMAEAEALIQPWLATSGAKPVPPSRKLEKTWLGTFKGGLVELGIAKKINTPIVRGAAIVARAMK